MPAFVRLPLAALVLSFVLTARAVAQPIDDFSGDPRWTCLPSDGVQATIRTDSVDGDEALRLDYDFTRGMGFVVVRREVALDVPADYRFSFRVRGDGPPNNFEFKLVEAGPDGTPGDNVWWINNRAYDWPASWKSVAYRNRHISFAWGPSGGKAPLRKIAAIEFAVAASSGGKGTLWIDDLRLDPAPPPDDAPPVVHADRPTSLAPKLFASEFAHAVRFDARSPKVEVEFSSLREIGVIVLDLASAADIEIATSQDGNILKELRREKAHAGRNWIQTPGLEARTLRVKISPTQSGEHTLRVLGPTVGDDTNALLQEMARHAPRGHYPRYLHGEATSWTVLGLPAAEHEALLSADGQVEIYKGGFAIEPFIQLDTPAGSKLLSWADATIEHGLNAGQIPRVTWRLRDGARELTFAITPGDAGSPDHPAVGTVYTLSASATTRARLLLAVRPLQTLPPSQWLNVTGGFAPIRTIETRPDAAALLINNAYAVVPMNAAHIGMHIGSGLAGEFGGSIPQILALPEAVREPSVIHDPAGLAWGVITTAWETITPTQTLNATLLANLRPLAAVESPTDVKKLAPTFDPSGTSWQPRTSRVRLRVPPSARGLEETWRSQQRMILVNTDGPAYQPGSRTYERAWIRDGASIGAAMCFTGDADSMRTFVDWYAAYQYDSGKIPCVVDKRGPDPVPEHDSHGEYIHAVATVYRFTGDRAFLTRHWPRVQRAAAYLDAIIAERSTAAYDSDAPGSSERGFSIPRRAFRGLVPESISHEGYSAKPMHSHWDGFWTVRGYKDAAFLASILGDPREEDFGRRAAGYRESMARSIAISNPITGADWVPGCVELGDFDATSTAIAVWPIEEWKKPGGIPTPLFEKTFEKYWSFFEARRAGTAEWKDYTPYEVRMIGAMLRLADHDVKWLTRAHELDAWFRADQRPAGWRQWGEVVFRDKSHPGFIGDYPHTWVGADYLNSVRAIFVDEREPRTLVLGQGLTDAWLTEQPRGLGIDDAPTWFGPVSWTIDASDRDAVLWTVTPRFRADAGEITVTIAAPWPLTDAQAVGARIVETRGRFVTLSGPYASTIEVRARRR